MLGVHDMITEALKKNPDLPQPMGAPSVCIKLLTDSLLSALIYDQNEIKENFIQKIIDWEVRKKIKQKKRNEFNCFIMFDCFMMRLLVCMITIRDRKKDILYHQNYFHFF